MTVPAGPGPGAVRSPAGVDEFRTRRAAAWAELMTLAGQRDRRRSPGDVLRLARLHREAVTDLALARRRWPGESVVDALEALVVSSHAALFRAPSPGRALGRLLHRAGLATAASRSSVALAAAVLVGFAAVGAAWVVADEASGARVLSVSLRRDILEGSWAAPVGPLAAVAAFALGAAGVVLGVVVLAWVGLEIGAAGALAAQSGDGPDAVAALLAAAPLVSGVIVAAGIGAHAGWSLLQGDRRSWAERVAAATAPFAVLLPVLAVASVLPWAAISSPRPAGAAGAVMAALLWAAVVRSGPAP